MDKKTLFILLWPVIGVFSLSKDFVDDFEFIMINFNFYPPSLGYIFSYWFKFEPLWKKIYLNSWYLNSLIICFLYFIWIKRNPSHLDNLERKLSPLKILGYSIFAISGSIFLCSKIGFNSENALSDKLKFLFFTNTGFILIMPFLLIGVSCGLVAGLSGFWILFRKFFSNFKG